MFKIDVVVGASSVHHFDVLVFVFHDFILDGAVVSVLAVVLDFAIDVWILGIDIPCQELLGKRKSLDFRNSNVNELCLRIVEDVVVSEETIAAQVVGDLVALFH